MVKVTFGSVFLVLSSLTTFAFATPTVVASYYVNNVATGNYIYSDGYESPGQLVSTAASSAAVSINLKNRDKSFSGMKGAAGYYVSVDTDAVGANLVWATKSYPWSFTMIDPTDPNTNYIVKVIGEQLYWYDDGSGYLILAPSVDVHRGATNFTILSA